MTFTEEEMSQTKAVIKNQYLETIDTARGTVEIMYHNIVAGKKISFEDLISKNRYRNKRRDHESSRKD